MFWKRENISCWRRRREAVREMSSSLPSPGLERVDRQTSPWTDVRWIKPPTPTVILLRAILHICSYVNYTKYFRKWSFWRQVRLEQDLPLRIVPPQSSGLSTELFPFSSSNLNVSEIIQFHIEDCIRVSLFSNKIYQYKNNAQFQHWTCIPLIFI